MSAGTQDVIRDYLCQGIPVTVGMFLLGVKVPQDPSVEGNSSRDVSIPEALANLSAVSRGNSFADVGVFQEKLVEFLPGNAFHAAHSMAIDGIVAIDNQLHWRARNSWGGSGSMYFPVKETCRIFQASAYVLPGEPGQTMDLLGKARN